MRRYAAALLVLPVLGLSLAFAILNAPVGRTRTPKEFEVRPGESGVSIARRLRNEGLVRSASFFHLASRLTGNTRRLRKGLYLLNDTMSTLQILRTIAEGRVYTVRVTVPEGWPVVKIARLLEEKELVPSRTAFERFCLSSNAFRTSHPFVLGPNLEGYLYPDTYDIPKNATMRQIALTMVLRWSNRILRPYAEEIRHSRLKPYDLLKLASLIEKEARVASERPLISQVFHKRLRRGIPLACDPTVAYAVGKHYGERLRTKDLRFDSPYNTYLYPGLPPTPICNPGAASFEAALRPADTDYLYFVAKNDGTHHFSRTAAEHEAAVDKYQRGR